MKAEFILSQKHQQLEFTTWKSSQLKNGQPVQVSIGNTLGKSSIEVPTLPEEWMHQRSNEGKMSIACSLYVQVNSSKVSKRSENEEPPAKIIYRPTALHFGEVVVVL